MKDWTIMVYMAGDNNLSENMAFSLEDIRAFASAGRGTTDKINILTFFDSNSLTAPTIFTDYSDGEPESHAMTVADLHHRSENTRLPENLPPELKLDGDSASAYSIMNFVRWCIHTKKRTAENYAIIFSGHSFGFHGTSFLRDEDSGGFITLFKFRWALEEIIKEYLGQNIAILGFDSCVMSMLEIGFELKDIARTIVASEGSLPNSGWSYAPMLKTLIEKFNVEVANKETQKMLSVDYFSSGKYVKDAAQDFVGSYIEQHKKMVVGGRSIDISAWDLEKVVPLAQKVNELAIELNNFLYLADKVQKGDLSNDDIWAFHELKKIILQAHYDTQTYMHEQCIDLKDFCKRLFIELKFIENNGQSKVFDNLKKICLQTIERVDDCVLKSGFCGDEYQFSNGISLYFPWSCLTFDLTDFRYRWLEINRGKRNYDVYKPESLKGAGKDWYAFLFNYLTRVTIRLTRKRLDERGVEQISVFEDFGKDSPIWNKDNQIWSNKNPIWSRDNPRASRDNPPASRDNPRASRDNPRASRGEIGNYLFYFSRFKNYDLRWNISGFADEFPFKSEFDTVDEQDSEPERD